MTGHWGYPEAPQKSLDEFLQGEAEVAVEREPLPAMFVRMGDDIVDVSRLIAVTHEGEGFTALHLEHSVVIDVDLTVDEVMAVLEKAVALLCQT